MKSSEPNGKTIRILVIEDNLSLVTAGLQAFFRPGRHVLQITATAVSPSVAIGTVNDNTFDIILLDLFIPGTSPDDNVKSLHSHFPGKPVVIYTSLDSDGWRRKMFGLGVFGYVHKNDPREVLMQVLLSASEGTRSIRYSGRPEPGMLPVPADPSGLSATERVITSLISEGRRYKAIAKELDLSVATVESIVKRLRTRFDVKSTSQLIRILADQHLI